MGPPVEYARTTDGVSIAYAAFGDGPPLVLMPGIPFSNFLAEWDVPLLATVYQRLGAHFRVVQYDGRGTGHSQRDVSDLSLNALVADLEAVLGRLGIASAGLFAIHNSCPIAIAFAAARPDRVTRLCLYGGAARAWQAMSAEETQALLSLIERDWGLFAEMAAHAWMGWSAGEAGRLAGEAFRTAVTPAVARATLQALSGVDVTALVPSVSAPVLVLHRRNLRQLEIEDSRSLARAFPKGRLVVVEGDAPALFFEHTEAVVEVLTNFFVGRSAAVADEADAPERVAPRVTAELSPRELEVLRLLAAGETNASIAHRLALTVHTVERHVVNIYRKIDARGRADATAFAIRHGLD